MHFDPFAIANVASPVATPNIPSQGATTPGNGAFSHALASVSFNPENAKVSNTTATPVHRAAEPQAPVRELQRTSMMPSENALGNQVLHRLEALHRGDQKLHTNGPNTGAEHSSVAIVGVGTQPGPAAGPLNTGSAHDKRLAGASIDQFNVMLRNFEQIYQQSVQVGLMTKSTGAFTTSMNKLMSSA